MFITNRSYKPQKQSMGAIQNLWVMCSLYNSKVHVLCIIAEKSVDPVQMNYEKGTDLVEKFCAEGTNSNGRGNFSNQLGVWGTVSPPPPKWLQGRALVEGQEQSPLRSFSTFYIVKFQKFYSLAFLLTFSEIIERKYSGIHKSTTKHHPVCSIS